jgi:TonB-linked SusC/RagA family outer membrane protein
MRRTWHVFTSGAFTGAVGAFAGAVVGAFGGAPAPALAQTGTGRIVGTVTESTQNTPLANAGVGAVGGTIGARTGADGRYAINGVAPGRYVIRAQTIGYTAQTDTVQVAAGQTLTLNFSLRQVTTALQQVVVVGYGTQRRTDVTGSVASVTPNVERQPVTSVEQTLQGTAPGVQVTQASSAPGGGMSIRIRGGSSVNGSNEPLYVIDGFPVDNDVNASSPGDGGRGSTAPANPLAALNPNDIASIEILKDASATAIYGSRGANGVVLITTKRGQGNRPRVTLDTYTGVQNVAKRYELLDAQEYARFANSWATAQNQVLPYTDTQIAQFGRGTNWQDQIFRAAPMYNAQLGVTGGGGGENQTRYALSGGVFNQQGVVHGSNFRRLSLRANLDQMVGSRVRLGSNVLLSRVNSAQVPTDGSLNAGAGAVGAALQYAPLIPVYRPDGTYTLTTIDFPNELAAIGVAPINVPNPVASAFAVQDALYDTRALANAVGEVTLVEGLRFRTSVGSDLSFRGRDTYYPRTTLQGAALGGRALRSRVDNTSFLNENTLNYDRSFGNAHRVSSVVGYTRQSLNSVRGNTTNSNFVSDITGYESIGAGSQAGGPNVGSGRTRWTLASYLGRVNYSLLDRYLFTVTGRRDGSSRFGANNRWGFFPAAAVGWRASEESFLRDVRGLSNLKLRYSIGVAGNPSISPYQSLNRLLPQQYTFGGQLAPGYQPSAIGNPELSWETTRQSDLGLDLGLFNGRVDFTGDYYVKKTNDLLLQISLPSEVGYSTAFVNAGSVQNKGVELGLTLRVLDAAGRRNALGWTTTFNYSRNRNRVLDLGGVNRIFARDATISDLQSGTGTSSSVVQVGQPIGAFYGYQTVGLFRDSVTLNAWRAKTRLESGTPGLGNVQYVDIDGNGVINSLDRTVIGDPNPKYTIGWQNTVSFRGFELSGLFDGSYGNQVLNLNNIRLGGASPSTNVLRERVLDAWSPENPNGKWQRIGAGFGQQGTDITSEVLEDGSYLRLRTVSLARAIPTSWLRGRAPEARVYVTGQNLLTWSKYSGFNPDVSSLGVGNLNRGVDVGSYPLARTVTFGLNFTY